MSNLEKYLGVDSIEPTPKKKNDYVKLEDHIVAYWNGIKFLLSLEDEYLLHLRKFHGHKGHRGCVYFRCTINGKRYFLHNLIMQPPKGYVVDHVNGDSTDNRRDNLRLCTPSQNMQNRRGKLAHTLPKGISYRKDCNKYRAYIGINNKRINLGQFSTLEEAVRIRLEAEEKYFGDYRRREDNE